MPSHDSSPAFAVADKEIAKVIGMSLAWVRKDRATKRILPFFRIGDSVRYDVATVRNVMFSRMEGGNPRLEDGDKHLMEKLKAEGEGILSWLVQGAVSYNRDGLAPPPDVVEMTNAYLSEQDSFGRWLADMETCGLAQGTGASALFEIFKGWCVLNGANLSPATFTAFGKTAASRNIQKGRGASGVVYGLRPLPVDFF